MALLLNRRDHIDRVEVRISRLRDRAAELLESEEQLSVKVEDLRESAEQCSGRLRAARVSRGLERAERRLGKLREERTELVDEEIRAIMRALQEQSHKTRLRLDRELARLAPVEAEWERLRTAFETLQDAVSAPALEQVIPAWQGELEVPEFPVKERDGYAKPFPEHAVVF